MNCNETENKIDLQKLNDYIARNKAEIISDVIELINIPSVKGNGTAVTDALNAVIDIAKRFGFKASAACGGSVGVVEFGEGDETVGILAHVDVVPEGDKNLWKTPPFCGTLRDGFLVGRGSIDDKGPLIAALYAMKAVEQLGIKLHKKVQMVIGTQEETVWTDIAKYSRKYRLPDFGFTPDGEFPVTNIEKGYADAVLSFSDKKDDSLKTKIVSIKGGAACNIVPDTASSVIKCRSESEKNRIKAIFAYEQNDFLKCSFSQDEVTVTAHGKSVHSSIPEKGENAVCRLCSFLNRLSANGSCARLAAFVDECLCEDFYGTGLGLFNRGETYNGEYVHRTVVVPAFVFTNGTECKLSVNFRISFPTTRCQIEKALSELSRKYGFTFVLNDYSAPIYIAKDIPFVKILAQTYTEMTDDTNQFALAYGMSYAHAMKNIVSFGPTFPFEEDFSHEANERIRIESLIKSSQIYACAIARLAASDRRLAN